MKRTQNFDRIQEMIGGISITGKKIRSLSRAHQEAHEGIAVRRSAELDRFEKEGDAFFTPLVGDREERLNEQMGRLVGT
jgi:hypothetical protein